VIVIRYDLRKNSVSLYFKGLTDDVKKFLNDISNDIEDYFWSFEKLKSEAVKLQQWRPISRNAPIVILQSSDPDKVMWKISQSSFKLFVGSRYPQLLGCKTWGEVLEVVGVKQ